MEVRRAGPARVLVGFVDALAAPEVYAPRSRGRTTRVALQCRIVRFATRNIDTLHQGARD